MIAVLLSYAAVFIIPHDKWLNLAMLMLCDEFAKVCS